MRNQSNPPKVGEIFPTSRWGDVIVKEYNGYLDVIVQFKDGSVKRTATKELRKGMVKNNNQPEVCGVGFIGDGEFSCKRGRKGNSPEYEVWRGMIRRCYDPKCWELHPTYEGCTVHTDWHNFQNFARWYTKQSGYEARWHLDKDFLVIGNKMYSENTCTLIPNEINSLMSGGGKLKRGSCPIGVHFCNTKKRYIAQIHRGDGPAQDYLGTYHNVEDAFIAYKVAKEAYIKQVVDKFKGQISEIIYNNLYNHVVTVND